MKNPKEFAAYYQLQAIMLSLIVMGLAILILFYYKEDDFAFLK